MTPCLTNSAKRTRRGCRDVSRHVHDRPTHVERRIHVAGKLHLRRPIDQRSVGVVDGVLEEALVDGVGLVDEKSVASPVLVLDDLGRVGREDESDVANGDMRHAAVVAHLVRAVDDDRAVRRELAQLVPERLGVDAEVLRLQQSASSQRGLTRLVGIVVGQHGVEVAGRAVASRDVGGDRCRRVPPLEPRAPHRRLCDEIRLALERRV